MRLELAAAVGGVVMVIVGVGLLTRWPVALVLAGVAAAAWGLLHDDGVPPAGRPGGPVR